MCCPLPGPAIATALPRAEGKTLVSGDLFSSPTIPMPSLSRPKTRSPVPHRRPRGSNGWRSLHDDGQESPGKHLPDVCSNPRHKGPCAHRGGAARRVSRAMCRGCPARRGHLLFSTQLNLTPQLRLRGRRWPHNRRASPGPGLPGECWRAGRWGPEK